MDWRSFLFLLVIVMQPEMSCKDHLRQGYALYCSQGSFDAECTSRISLKMMKDILCAPVLLSMKSK
jgi:hypothetical protein